MHGCQYPRYMRLAFLGFCINEGLEATIVSKMKSGMKSGIQNGFHTYSLLQPFKSYT